MTLSDKITYKDYDEDIWDIPFKDVKEFIKELKKEFYDWDRFSGHKSSFIKMLNKLAGEELTTLNEEITELKGK
jgi:hypothetical protein